MLGIGEPVQGTQERMGGTKGMVRHAGGFWSFSFLFFFNLKSLRMCYLNWICSISFEFKTHGTFHDQVVYDLSVFGITPDLLLHLKFIPCLNPK